MQMVNHPNRSRKAQGLAAALDEIRALAASADWHLHTKAELFNLLSDVYHSANDALSPSLSNSER